MSILSKYNKKNMFNFEIPEDFEYFSLETLYKDNGENKQYPIKAFFINKKSLYGDSPVAVTDTCLVNLPNHMVETIEEILKDEEAIAEINEGKGAFQIYSYTLKDRSGIYYSIKFIDL